MKNPVVRVLLLVLAAAAAGSAAYGVVTFERRAVADEALAQISRDQAMAALSLVAELRAAQRGYVAVGQPHQYWTARVTDLLVDLEDRLRRIREGARSDAGLAAIESAAAAIENFRELDARAQDYVSLDQLFLASDLIFSDGLDMTGAAAAGIEEALSEAQVAHDATVHELRRWQALAIGGAGAALLLVSLLLFPARTARDESLEPEADAGLDPSADIEGLDEPVRQRADTAAAARRMDGWEADPPAATDHPALDLEGAARLCTELGRVMETSELPPLLARAAGLLDAAGLVVWVTDPSGAELRPVLTHGYSEKIVAQMRGIPTGAQNAAALTYRSAEARIVSGNGAANGAFVVPLITPAGCVGVFATELKRGAEQRPATRALTTILAAQVATLVGATPAPGAAHARA